MDRARVQAWAPGAINSTWPESGITTVSTDLPRRLIRSAKAAARPVEAAVFDVPHRDAPAAQVVGGVVHDRQRATLERQHPPWTIRTTGNGPLPAGVQASTNSSGAGP